MLNLNHEAKSIKDSFRLTKEQEDIFDEIMEHVIKNMDALPATWAIQRVWVEERFNDNARAYAVFTIGRFYEHQYYNRGGEVH